MSNVNSPDLRSDATQHTSQARRRGHFHAPRRQQAPSPSGPGQNVSEDDGNIDLQQTLGSSVQGSSHKPAASLERNLEREIGQLREQVAEKHKHQTALRRPADLIPGAGVAARTYQLQQVAPLATQAPLSSDPEARFRILDAAEGALSQAENSDADADGPPSLTLGDIGLSADDMTQMEGAVKELEQQQQQQQLTLADIGLSPGDLRRVEESTAPEAWVNDDGSQQLTLGDIGLSPQDMQQFERGGSEQDGKLPREDQAITLGELGLTLDDIERANEAISDSEAEDPADQIQLGDLGLHLSDLSVQDDSDDEPGLDVA